MDIAVSIIGFELIAVMLFGLSFVVLSMFGFKSATDETDRETALRFLCGLVAANVLTGIVMLNKDWYLDNSGLGFCIILSIQSFITGFIFSSCSKT